VVQPRKYWAETGHDTAMAEYLLLAFERMLILRKADRDRIRTELVTARTGAATTIETPRV
jgi:hypothetical protein